MRILGMADLHDRTDMLYPLRGVKADLIAFCGDLHDGSGPNRARETARSLAGLGLPVLIVPGNMDRRDVVLDLWREEGLHLLHRSTWTLRGHCFIGLGGMVARNPQRLGDPARFYHTDEEAYECLSRIWSEIHCTGRRIVIVHQPPRGAQDTLYTGESSGSTALRRFVDEHQPDLLLCGHIHECRGESWIGSCRIVNLGEMRLGYAAMIELEDGIRVEWIGPSGHIPKG